MENDVLIIHKIPRLVHIFIIICIISFSVFVGFYQLKPPDPEPADISLTQFSSGRAMEYLENIAVKPHPVGSEEHSRVRDYITEKVKEFGFKAEIHSSNPSVENIFVKVDGKGKSKDTILISAHYDTVPGAPGAGDNGSGVAVLLESLRVLKASEKLRNNIIFLFTDGEETGLYGSKAFIREYPYIDDIKIVLNFDGKGCSGYSLMFNTGKNNRWIVKEFAKAAPYPIAFSSSIKAADDAFGLNDFDGFKEINKQGLNFIFNKGLYAYHSKKDTITNLDERVIQHHGTNAVSLLKHFGNMDLEAEMRNEGDAIYFNVMRSLIVVYPKIWAIPLAILTVGLFGLLVWIGLKNNMFTIKGIVQGLICFVISLIFTFEIITIIESSTERVFKNHLEKILFNDFGDIFLASFAFLTIAIVSLIYNFLGKRISTLELLFGSFAYWIGMSLYYSVFEFGTSYLYTWPILLGLIGISVVVLYKEKTVKIRSFYIAFLLTAVPYFVLFTPAIYTYYVDQTLRLSGIYMWMFVLGLGIIMPYIYIVFKRKLWVLPVVSASLSAVIFAVGSLSLLN
ncbi:M20/M25/M40 family metallo-hydrolase [Acetivibrio clariflavus]|uniref:M20/M25/M40 family metallo-hydrolase n=1 Tax=Acetivibrio clariflavus TaxID=288965 RepID=UPI0004803960|nr:M20/M25/M40 family metallo-hydrolase [Acetivibrio clariflavus]